MKVIVKPHSIQVVSTPVNEQEVNITKVEFEFSEEITNDYVKEAYFTLDDNTYKQVIVNNECQIPSEVLTKVGTIQLGVVAYYADPANNELIRYNPKPGYFTSWEGSLKDAENSQPITPSEMQQFETALQDGLNEIDIALDDLQEKVDSGYFDGQDGRDGTDGITPTIGDNGNWYLGSTDTGKPSRGEKGLTGDTGATGSPGIDGYSPIANVSKNGSTTTITITDKNGTTTTTVNDGTNGRDGYVQYIAGDNITIEDNVISATGGGSSYIAGEGIDITNDIISSTLPIYTVDVATNANPFIVEGKPLGLYLFKQIPSPWISGYSGGNKQSIQLYNGFILLTNTTIDHNSATYQQIGYVWGTQLDSSYGYVGNYNGTLTVYGTTGKTTVGNSSNAYAVASSGNSSIGGVKTFTTLPESSATPTKNTQLTTKSYVDNAIASAITTALGGEY